MELTSFRVNLSSQFKFVINQVFVVFNILATSMFPESRCFNIRDLRSFKNLFGIVYNNIISLNLEIKQSALDVGVIYQLQTQAC